MALSAKLVYALAPEKFTNYELGAKWDFHHDLAVTAAVYRLDRRNVAITDPADPTKSLLVDGQRAQGVELGLTGRLTRNWSVVEALWDGGRSCVVAWRLLEQRSQERPVRQS